MDNNFLLFRSFFFYNFFLIMSKEIKIPKDFDKGLKKGDLKLGGISQNVNDNITNELYDDFVKKINEEFEKEIKND